MESERIILSTLEHVPGMDIEEHMGMISGAAVARLSWAQRFIWAWKEFFGGLSPHLDAVFNMARDNALEKLEAEAANLGANAVINLRFESLRAATGYCEVHAYGSAVRANSY